MTTLRRTGLARRTELRRTPMPRGTRERSERVHRSIQRRADAYDPEVRFWKQVTRGPVPSANPSLGPCLIHSGADNGNGYVQFRYNGRGDYAHRYAWERVHGPIPDDQTVDHLCEVKRCVNDQHMELATSVDNYLRTALAKKECPNGHEYKPGSYKVRNGARACLVCQKVTMRRGSRRRSRSANGLPDRRNRYDQALVRQVIAEVRAAELTIAAGARRIGCNANYLGRRVWQETRADVLVRDAHRCARCGGQASDAHHRILRGNGGSSLPRIAFGMDNLISLCRECHTWAHEHPADARPDGWMLRRTDDPSATPITIHGRREQVRLTLDGQYEDVAA